MLLKVRKTIEKHGMFRHGDRILVAVSGGPDSTALLHVLLQLKEKLGLELHVAHFNHGLRKEESDRDEAFVRDLAQKHLLPFSCGRIDTDAHALTAGMTVEERARSERYRFLKEEAAKCNADKIATGHTKDDQAETLLMRILRGSGPAGLAGIPPVNGAVVRPLIDLTREEVEQYLRERNIQFVIDSSNLDLKFQRNWIRHVAVPVLKQRQPNLTQLLSNAAERFAAIQAHFSALAQELSRSLFTRRDAAQIDIDLEKLAEYDEVVRSYCLRLAVSELKGSDYGVFSRHIRLLDDVIRSPKSFACSRLPGRLFATKSGTTLTLSRKEPEAAACQASQEIAMPGMTVIAPCAVVVESRIEDIRNLSRPEVRRDPREEWFDSEKVELPLVCRTPKPGDRMRPFGMVGTKKLKKLFNEYGIPSDRRRAMPLICARDEILWVVGLRRSAACPVDDGTRRVLILRARPLEP